MIVKKISRFFLVLALSFVTGIVTPSYAGMPVIDGTNLITNILKYVEMVAQTAEQISQYTTQLQQYENMIKNTESLLTGSWLWDDVNSIMTSLRGSIDTLSQYKAALGSIDAYIGQFKDIADYRNSPCFSGGGCTSDQLKQLRTSGDLGSESQKKATDALFKGLDAQQTALVADAQKLAQLQTTAQGADGQMKAIAAANQLAGEEANQLLQIRALLVAEQNVVATRNQALADQEALKAAATQNATSGDSEVHSSHTSY